MRARIPATLALISALTACGGGTEPETTETASRAETASRVPTHPGAGAMGPLNDKPAWLGDVHATTYDGVSDDLLTAGLGAAGLAAATPPGYADPLHPTAAELRRNAIYNNYRALVDTRSGGGYGSLYGPNVGVAGDGKVAGTEYLAFSDDGSGTQNVTLMVQVPNSFNPSAPCIVTATSSGSRGIYGGISTGEWGLKRGCVVAYTDKGTGAAPHDLSRDTVPLIVGTRASSAEAGHQAAFRAPITAEQRAAFNAATPWRFAFKHAHSQRNPEKDWGRFTLQSVQFAFWVLNELHGAHLPGGRTLRTIVPHNTLVIASSISNGGGAAIAAAEQDVFGLIDGVAVAEPQISLPARLPVGVRRGATDVPTFGKTLFDYTTVAHLYQLCASLAPSANDAPGLSAVPATIAANRCTSLAEKGLLSGSTPEERAADALARLRAYGWEPEADLLHASHSAFEIASAVSITYANALSRSSVADNLCNYSFAASDPSFAVVPLPDAALASLFANSNGIPPTAGVYIINNTAPEGRNHVSWSPSTGRQDANIDGALCLRGLLTGAEPAARALQAGLGEIRRTGHLRHKPAIIVHGRSDALVPVNHTSRPYTALNKLVEGGRSRLSYIEVTNAQHFDGFIGLPAVPGYDTRFVPLHLYLNRALDAMWDNLTLGKPLPPSQVVRTVPRGGTPGSAPAITAANVPPIAPTPAPGDAVTMKGATLVVPE